MSVREAILGELEVLVGKEQRHLSSALQSVSGPLREVVAGDLKGALQHLSALLEWSKGGLLVELPGRAAYAFKRSVNARTSLLRHTPALAGAPAAFDSSQRALSLGELEMKASGSRSLNSAHPEYAEEDGPSSIDQDRRGRVLVDYARGGYLLHFDPDFPEGIRFDDHPRLVQAARTISSTLGRSEAWKPLLFSSGMGAINTAVDLAVERSRGRRLLLGAHSWVEVQEYVEHTYPGRFELFDESDTPAIVAALADPQVGAVFLEPLVNHPRAPVVEIDRVLKAELVGPKLLTLDLALTPEFRVDDFVGQLPPDVTLMLVTSGVKFFQAGWDISKSGLLETRSGPQSGPAWETPERQLITLRGRSGRVLSPEEAELAALETPATLRARLTRLDFNTQQLAVSLDTRLRALGLGAVISPWLASHSHHGRIEAVGTGGRFVYVKLDPSKVPEERVAELDRDLARAAASRNVPLIVATTFGLSLPHVCLLAHPTEGLTLRISAGSGEDLSEALNELLRSVLEGSRG